MTLLRVAADRRAAFHGGVMVPLPPREEVEPHTCHSRFLRVLVPNDIF